MNNHRWRNVASVGAVLLTAALLAAVLQDAAQHMKRLTPKPVPSGSNFTRIADKVAAGEELAHPGERSEHVPRVCHASATGC